MFLRSRDGPDQSSPQIGQFSGNTALESVYSTSNIILIKFHSDFSGAGFFVLSYHGKTLLCPLGDIYCMLCISMPLHCFCLKWPSHFPPCPNSYKDVISYCCSNSDRSVFALDSSLTSSASRSTQTCSLTLTHEVLSPAGIFLPSD